MRRLLKLESGIVPYRVAYAWQRSLHARRVAGEIEDTLLLLEHPKVYTLGRNFDPSHLLESRAEIVRRGTEVVEADRGGSITYHGPGQLVAYPVIDLRGAPGSLPDLMGYLRLLERAVIETVTEFGLQAAARRGFTGVWVGEAKLACVGVNVSRGVSKHGLALNVSTDLTNFGSMMPCGIEDCRMTSLCEQLGRALQPTEISSTLARNLAAALDLRLESVAASDLGLDGPAASYGIGA